MFSHFSFFQANAARIFGGMLIGLSTAILLLLNGRIAGIVGRLAQGRRPPPTSAPSSDSRSGRVADNGLTTPEPQKPTSSTGATIRGSFRYDWKLAHIPKIDGISFIRKLRAVPAYADIPIVMITSIETEDIRIRVLEAGATDFLPKRPHIFLVVQGATLPQPTSFW